MGLTEEVFVILAAVVLLALARWVQQWLYGRTLHALLTEDDNPAMGIAIAGYLFGVFWTRHRLAWQSELRAACQIFWPCCSMGGLGLCSSLW